MLKLKKFTAALLLTAALVMPAGAGNARNVRNMNFQDVLPGSWYYPYVRRLYGDRVINGVSYYLYAPAQTVRTSEVAALIARYLGLERAARQRRDRLIGNNIEGGSLWYAGYIQVLSELYILDSAHLSRLGLWRNAYGETAISSGASALIEAPIIRMDMVRLIARSFQIPNTQALRSGSLLPGEISGNGNEFITGGGYEQAVLDRIAAYRIADFQDIPEEYRVYFLKLFYNGIIGGDEHGRVLPHNNLRRSELARIIASVMYFDLRGGDLRELPAVSLITPEDFVISGIDGSKFLNAERAAQILRAQAENISASVYGGVINIRVEQQNIIPKGFLNEIYIYRLYGRVTSELARLNTAANASAYFPRVNSFTMAAGGADPAGYIYLVLRDLTRGGEIAGAVMLNIGADGSLTEAPVR